MNGWPPHRITVSVYHQFMTVRTTLSLDQDVYEATAHLARTSGQRLGKVLSELARRGLRPQEQAMPRRRHSRFPTVAVPQDAPVIPASRIERFLDEEGYI